MSYKHAIPHWGHEGTHATWVKSFSVLGFVRVRQLLMTWLPHTRSAVECQCVTVGQEGVSMVFIAAALPTAQDLYTS